MRINPVKTSGNPQNAGKTPAFKAVLLKDNLMFFDQMTHSPINGAVVELETETRELIADSRRKVMQNHTEQELKANFSFGWWSELTKFAAMDMLAYNSEKKKPIYKGDYNLMDELAQRDELPFIKEIHKRVQKNDMYYEQGSPFTTSRKYWHAVTNGKTSYPPEGYDGLLDKDLYKYLSRTGEDPLDSIIPNTNDFALRQRILLAVQHRNDGNYRNLSASKVFGIAEVYTDRASDVVEEMSADEEKRMAQLRKDDAKYDEMYQMWCKMDDSPEKENLYSELNRLAKNICVSYGIRMSDFLHVKYGKKYLKSNEEIGRDMIERAQITEDNIHPVNVNLMGKFEYLTGVGQALLDAICEKGKYCGVYADLGGSYSYNIFFKNGFKHLAGLKDNKLFKPGIIKLNRFA